MSKSCLNCASVVFIVAIGIAGCRQDGAPATRESSSYVRRDAAPQVAAAPPATAPSLRPLPDAPPPPGTAQALAKRAATYAQYVEPLIAKRQERPRSESPSASDAETATPQNLSARSADAAARSTPEPTVAQANGAIPGGSLAPSPQASPRKPAPENAQASIADGVAPSAVSQAQETTWRKLAQRAQDYPRDLSAQMDDQLLKLLGDNAVPESKSLSGLSGEDREVLSALMDSLSNFRNQVRSDDNMLLSKKIRPLLELGDRLSAQAELAVPTVALCTRVTSFGVYDPIEPARFVAGKEHPIIVYCEVENFLSQLTDQGRYETRLDQDVVLYTESSGMPVWSLKRSECVDLSHRRHHDFFMVRKTALPASLTIGSYLLKVTVEDEHAKHIAENTLPIEIVAG